MHACPFCFLIFTYTHHHSTMQLTALDQNLVTGAL